MTSKATDRLNRLVERWGGAKTAQAPVEVTPRAPRAEADPATPAPDPVALVEALRAEILRAFEPNSQELALALALVEDEVGKKMAAATKPPASMKITDLVRAMFPPGGEAAPADLKVFRKQLGLALDELEDLLDGLSVAIAARTPGGAARG